MLHVSFALLEPVQYFPPFFVDGSLHFLDLLLRPESHDFEQLVQGPQVLHPPLTGPNIYEEDVIYMKVF